MITRFVRSYFYENTGSPGYRFRKGDEPTQDSFQKLTDSVGFITSADDTATISAQGFGKLATDANSYGLNSTVDIDSYSKVVQPHQLPVVVSGTGMSVVKSSSGTGRTGGTGASYLATNIMSILEDDPGNQPIVVVQAGPGEDATLSWDESLNPNRGKIAVVNGDDLDYLEQKINCDDESIEFELLGGLPPATINIKVGKIGKPKEITMFWGTTAQIASQFSGGYCTTAGDKWKGWALCDGNTYNGVITPDMRGSFPVGVSALYPNCGTTNANQDSTTAQGANDITLTAVQSGLPGHTHAVTDPGHTHSYKNWPNQADIGDGGTTATANDAETNQTTGSSTTGVTIAAVASAPASVAHENRPPFMTVQFVIYVGF